MDGRLWHELKCRGLPGDARVVTILAPLTIDAEHSFEMRIDSRIGVKLAAGKGATLVSHQPGTILEPGEHVVKCHSVETDVQE
jgi:hypothetical protein